MPVDTRRLPVPDNSKPPCTFVKNEPHQQQPPGQLVNASGKRHDGRTCEQTRPIFANVGVVSQARGSAYIEIGRTKVLCAVYGPREVKYRDEFSLIGQLSCELKFATFSGRLRRSHQQDENEKEASVIVKEALEPAVRLDKFPKARIDVFLMVLEDDGCALATAISCASLALSDAAVEMFDLVVGSTLRQFADTRLVDPNSQEEYKPCESDSSPNNASVTVGFLPSLNQVSSIVQTGKLGLDATKLCVRQCIDVCQSVYPVLRQCLIKAIDQQQNGNK
jgi:exosome complex component MTR3